MGIRDYPSGSDLYYSLNEIKSFKNTLLMGDNWNESNIILLTDEDATKNNIFDSFDWLESNSDYNDLSIFYFVGHGGRSLDNEYIVAYDETIYDEELDEHLDGINGDQVVIIDSCYSGGFIKELRQRGRIVLTACKKDELTYQVKNLSSGIFGFFLNVSLEMLSKNIETAFRLTWLFSLIYSKKLSNQFDGDYTIHPQMYDGIFGKTKIIKNSIFTSYSISRFIFMSLEKNKQNIWKV